MPRSVAPYRTPLDLYMYLNDLTVRDVAQLTGLSPRAVWELQSGRRKMPTHTLQRVEDALGLPRGSLGSYSRVFRRHPLLWYRVVLDCTFGNKRCAYCRQPIRRAEVAFTIPWMVRTEPIRCHYTCFLNAWQEILDGVRSGMQALIDQEPEVEHEERGWYGGTEQATGAVNPPDQHHIE